MKPGTTPLENSTQNNHYRIELSENHDQFLVGPIYYAQNNLANAFKQAWNIMFSQCYDRVNSIPIAEHFAHTYDTVARLYPPMKGFHSKNNIRVLTEEELLGTEITLAFSALNLITRLPKIYGTNMDRWGQALDNGFSFIPKVREGLFEIKAGGTVRALPLEMSSFRIVEQLVDSRIREIVNTPEFHMTLSKLMLINELICENAEEYFAINKSHMATIPLSGIEVYRKAMLPEKVKNMHRIFEVLFDGYYNLDLSKLLNHDKDEWCLLENFHNFFGTISGIGEIYVFEI